MYLVIKREAERRVRGRRGIGRQGVTEGGREGEDEEEMKWDRERQRSQILSTMMWGEGGSEGG